jgi:hypothetical protein
MACKQRRNSRNKLVASRVFFLFLFDKKIFMKQKLLLALLFMFTTSMVFAQKVSVTKWNNDSMPSITTNQFCYLPATFKDSTAIYIATIQVYSALVKAEIPMMFEKIKMKANEIGGNAFLVNEFKEEEFKSNRKLVVDIFYLSDSAIERIQKTFTKNEVYIFETEKFNPLQTVQKNLMVIPMLPESKLIINEKSYILKEKEYLQFTLSALQPSLTIIKEGTKQSKPITLTFKENANAVFFTNNEIYTSIQKLNPIMSSLFSKQKNVIEIDKELGYLLLLLSTKAN